MVDGDIMNVYKKGLAGLRYSERVGQKTERTLSAGTEDSLRSRVAPVLNSHLPVAQTTRAVSGFMWILRI